MKIKTNLRALRHQYQIPLAALAVYAGLSKQYVSRAELGEIAATPLLEAQMASAIEFVIAARKAELRSLEEDYMNHKGRLLREEEHPNEQYPAFPAVR